MIIRQKCKSKRCLIKRNILLRKWVKKLKKMLDEREEMYEQKVEELHEEAGKLEDFIEFIQNNP